MGVAGGPNVVEDGLVFALDASDRNSYVSGSTSWFDLSGNNLSGSLFNGPVFNSGSGGNIVFDGSNDYVSFGDITTTEFGTGDFTISCWIFIPTDVVENINYFKGLIVKKGAAGGNAGYGIYYNTGYRKFLWSTANGSSGVERYTTNTWDSLKGRWSNIVMVRQNGATNNGFFYINGIYESIASSATIVNVNNDYNLTVGASSTLFGGYYFQGNIAAGSIYSRALSTQEVLQNYNATKTRFGL
jgi:Concanavalin A-like lectin/glucanases superfamily